MSSSWQSLRLRAQRVSGLSVIRKTTPNAECELDVTRRFTALICHGLMPGVAARPTTRKPIAIRILVHQSVEFRFRPSNGEPANCLSQSIKLFLGQYLSVR